MAVFWFGWGKKVKNALTKKQADSLYLPKSFATEISLKEVSIGNVVLRHNSLITKTNLGIDFVKPFIVRYTWLDPLNTNLQAGHSFMVNALVNEWNFGATNSKYNTSNKKKKKMNGDFVLGLCVVDENTIKFKASCINNNYRITNISLTGYPKK